MLVLSKKTTDAANEIMDQYAQASNRNGRSLDKVSFEWDSSF